MCTCRHADFHSVTHTHQHTHVHTNTHTHTRTHITKPEAMEAFVHLGALCAQTHTLTQLHTCKCARCNTCRSVCEFKLHTCKCATLGSVQVCKCVHTHAVAHLRTSTPAHPHREYRTHKLSTTPEAMEVFTRLHILYTQMHMLTHAQTLTS